MIGRRLAFLLCFILLTLSRSAPAANGAAPPDLAHLDSIVRNSGLLAPVLDSYPDAAARCTQGAAPDSFIIEYLSGQRVVGWASIQGESIRKHGQGTPPPAEFTVTKLPEPASPVSTLPTVPTVTPSVIPTEDEPSPEIPSSSLQDTDGDLLHWLLELLPRYRQSALLCLALVLTILIAFDLRILTFSRNLDLLSIFIVALASLGIFLSYGSEQNNVRLAAWSVILLATLWLFIRMLLLAFRRARRPDFEPNLPTSALVAILILVSLVHCEKLFRQDVGGSGVWSVRGAQHILSRGELPYGKLGTSIAYGPVLYLAQVPAVLAFPPSYTDERTGLPVSWAPATDDQKTRLAQLRDQLRRITPEGTRSEEAVALRDELAQLETGINHLPPARSLQLNAARVTAAVFDALILIGLIIIGTRTVDLRVGLSVATIYAMLPYTVDRLAHLSTLVPLAMIVWAIVLLSYPFVAGVLLALGAAATFFPAFLFPLWLNHYVGKTGAARFILGFLLVGLLSLAGGWFFTDNWTATQLREYSWSQVEIELQNTEQTLKTLPMDSLRKAQLDDQRQRLSRQLQSLKKPYIPLSFFFSRIVLPQESPVEQRLRLASFWGQVHAAGLPLSSVRAMLMLLAFMFYVALFFLPGQPTPLRLITLTTAVLLSTQLWKPVAGGLVTWYAPFLVLALLLYERKDTPKKPEKFVPLQDVNIQPVSAVEDIDAEIARRVGQRPAPPK